MTKKKNLLLAGAAIALITALSTHAMAQYADSPRNTSNGVWSNLYVGGFGGYGWTDADLAAGPTLDVNGGDWGLLVGYEVGGLMENNWISLNGGLEFHYAWSNADDSGGGVSIEKDDEWGVSFRPGLTFMSGAIFDTKPYAIIGYRRAEFDSTAGGSEDFNGFELGIGTELVAYGDLGVRLDYTHVFYADEAGINPDENDLRLGLVYHF